MADYISREAFADEMRQRQDAAKEWLREATVKQRTISSAQTAREWTVTENETDN